MVILSNLRCSIILQRHMWHHYTPLYHKKRYKYSKPWDAAKNKGPSSILFAPWPLAVICHLPSFEFTYLGCFKQAPALPSDSDVGKQRFH